MFLIKKLLYFDDILVPQLSICLMHSECIMVNAQLMHNGY